MRKDAAMASAETVAKKLIHVVIAGLVLLPAVATAAPPDSGNSASPPERPACEFVMSLNKPFKRIQFMFHISRIRKMNREDAADPAQMYGSIIKVSLNDSSEAEIDDLSVQCLSCHDGVYATGRLIRLKNNIDREPGSIDRVHGGHPIGMDYLKLAGRHPGLRRPDTLPPEVVLVQGKVGCLSCHNPLNQERPHLAATIANSSLCLTCHIK